MLTFKLLNLIRLFLMVFSQSGAGMDSADSGQQQQQDQASIGPGTSTGTNPGTSAGTQEIKTQTGLDLGNIFNQCSVSRVASIKMTVTEIKGGVCTTTPAQTPQIGSLSWDGDTDVL
jgi:hypothetical protein